MSLSSDSSAVVNYIPTVTSCWQFRDTAQCLDTSIVIRGSVLILKCHIIHGTMLYLEPLQVIVDWIMCHWTVWGYTYFLVFEQCYYDYYWYSADTGRVSTQVQCVVFILLYDTLLVYMLLVYSKTVKSTKKRDKKSQGKSEQMRSGIFSML